MTSPAIDPATSLVAFFTALPATGPLTADAVAQAFGQHLAGLDARQLPAAAQPAWERIETRLLKAPAGQSPIPPRQIKAIASWPASRVDELIEAIRRVATEVERAANDRLADETNTRVSRAYL